MILDNAVDEVTLVPCHMCLAQVHVRGLSEVQARDYVEHFCGQECYEKWSRGLDNPLQDPSHLKSGI